MDTCKKCGISFVGGPIPEEQRRLYGTTHFRKELAVYDEQRDIVVAFRCPACGYEWGRFLEWPIKPWEKENNNGNKS